jgi:ArsR family transcriptional regulator
MDMHSSHQELDDLALIFKVLADPTRLRLFEILISGEHCNCELGRVAGLSNNLVSHHMRVLTEAGMVQSRRDVEDARWVFYSVNRVKTELLLDHLAVFLHPQTVAPREPDCSPRKPSCS